jgi:hypothetical protein
MIIILIVHMLLKFYAQANSVRLIHIVIGSDPIIEFLGVFEGLDAEVKI